jgi:hypothetical protein
MNSTKQIPRKGWEEDEKQTMVAADFNDKLLPVSMAKVGAGRAYRHHASSSNSSKHKLR